MELAVEPDSDSGSLAILLVLPDSTPAAADADPRESPTSPAITTVAPVARTLIALLRKAPAGTLESLLASEVPGRAPQLPSSAARSRVPSATR